MGDTLFACISTSQSRAGVAVGWLAGRTFLFWFGFFFCLLLLWPAITPQTGNLLILVHRTDPDALGFALPLAQLSGETSRLDSCRKGAVKH